jgi:polyhydroxyalkanoate synthesis regulator phasin
MVVAPESLSGLNAEQLRELARDLIAQIANRDQTISSKDREILYRQTKIDQLTHEMAVLKRWKFGRSREQLDAGQASLLDEPIDADIAAIEQELQDLTPPGTPAKEINQRPSRLLKYLTLKLRPSVQ